MNDTGSLAAPPSQVTVNGRWLWSLRVAALLATGVLAAAVLRLFNSTGGNQLFGVALAVLSPLYLFALAGHFRNPPGPRGLSMGMILGLCTGAPFTLWTVSTWPYFATRDLADLTIPLLMLLGPVHLAWAVIAIRVNFLPGATRRGFQAFLPVLIAGVVFYAISFSFLYRGATVERISTPEASAVSSLRVITTAQVQYSVTYGSFASTLQALGPPPEGAQPSAEAADLIDSLLATGEKYGYEFTYAPAPPGEDGQIKAYTLTARPLEFGRTGGRNFLADQSGVIRSTTENRPATAQDPPIR